MAKLIKSSYCLVLSMTIKSRVKPEYALCTIVDSICDFALYSYNKRRCIGTRIFIDSLEDPAHFMVETCGIQRAVFAKDYYQLPANVCPKEYWMPSTSLRLQFTNSSIQYLRQSDNNQWYKMT